MQNYATFVKFGKCCNEMTGIFLEFEKKLSTFLLEPATSPVFFNAVATGVFAADSIVEDAPRWQPEDGALICIVSAPPAGSSK